MRRPAYLAVPLAYVVGVAVGSVLHQMTTRMNRRVFG